MVLSWQVDFKPEVKINDGVRVVGQSVATLLNENPHWKQFSNGGRTNFQAFQQALASMLELHVFEWMGAESYHIKCNSGEFLLTLKPQIGRKGQKQ
jgi:hypothetical protein